MCRAELHACSDIKAGEEVKPHGERSSELMYTMVMIPENLLTA
jgi:hypothetical protein